MKSGDTLTEDDLDKQSHASEVTKAFFGTVGQCFETAIGHPWLHAGQVTDARRGAASLADVIGTPSVEGQNMATQSLLDRVRRRLARRKGVAEKRMFGGNCFFANGNMLGGVTGDDQLIIRVGHDGYGQALKQRHAREMDFTGRPMRGFVVVDPAGISTDADLQGWLERGLAFARSLPPKDASK